MKGGVAFIHTELLDPQKAAQELSLKLREAAGGEPIQGGIIYTTIAHDIPALQNALSKELSGVPFAGITSCQGTGFNGTFCDNHPVTSIWFYGTDCKFVVASTPKEGEARHVGAALVQQLLFENQITIQEVNFSIFHTTPGDEEGILAGIQREFTKYLQRESRIPLIGGTAADNDISGKWLTWSHESVSPNLAILAAGRWPYRIMFKFRGGFIPTRKKGKVTRAHGRVLMEIDGKPAADVYNSWLGGAISRQVASGENILADVSLSPLGIARQTKLGIVSHIIIHPDHVILPEKSLMLFAEIATGEEVVVMSSYRSVLIERAGKTASLTIESAGFKKEEVAGALMIYCAGSMLTIRDKVDEVMKGLRGALQDAPHVVGFTFGEQGNIFPDRIEHGNLMNAIMIFTNRELTGALF